MLEENRLTSSSVQEMKKILSHKNLAKDISEYNFELGKKYFSMEVLEEKLLEVLKEVQC